MHACKIDVLTAATEELHLTHFQPKLTGLIHQHFLYVEVDVDADIPVTYWFFTWWD